jgi:hypothetical protein
MGIKHLNKFLREECAKSITCVDIKELANKVIVIDISIYMYKYQTEGVLIENIYMMLALFKHYQIIPVFVFDGKPPIEKRELLKQRYIDKVVAEAEYNRLSALLDQPSTITSHDKNELISAMDLLKKKIVYITKKQIADVKALIHAFGATYYDAPNEADELCALFVIKNKAWACMSEDMDMFVYGTPRVIRYFSLLNHTCVLYDTRSILQDLRMTQKEFSEICILSGTDYNLTQKNHNNTSVQHQHTLNDAMKIFNKYRGVNYFTGLYEWLLNENMIDSTEYVYLNHIYQMFTTQTEEYIRIVDNVKNVQNTLVVAKDKLRSILEEDGFIYR